ncbi:ABC transporter substrate-binding protein [Dactylosporangium sp. NPDC005572]|uniref:ABC transporter substrate-binding protein n=1 Tax=Dactylosporangium sp. NPDC005572 TaxID=3156889 RepID=UPI0033AE810C
MRHPFSKLAAAGAAAALLLTACSTDDGAAGGDSNGKPINLAIVYGITGAYSGTGAVYMKGFNAAVDDINAHGGIAGRKIKVNLIDDKSDITFAVSQITQLLHGKDKPDVVVPGGVSTETLGMLPVVSDAELFSVSVASSVAANDPSKYPNHFGVSSTQANQLASIGKSMAAKGVKKLAVLAGADAFGDTNVTGIKAVAEANGISIVATERPDPKALNFDVAFQRLAAAKPDAIYADFAAFDAIGRAFTSRLTVGATDIPYYAGTASASTVPTTLTDKKALVNCELPEFASMVQQSPAPTYFTPLLNAFKGNPGSAYSGALGYDTVQLIALAIERTNGDTDAAKLTQALIGQPIPANRLALYPEGYTLSNSDHFPKPTEKTFKAIPCDSSIVDGIWVPSAQS